MAELPTGTVTFLYTDIEGSTACWEQQPQAMRVAVARHDALLRHAVQAHGGQVFRTMGDGLCAAFVTAPNAVAAALAAQRALGAEAWGTAGPLRVRMALHTGAVEVQNGDYIGAALNRIARLLAAGHGGQVLVSQATSELVRDALPDGASLRNLGEYHLRDLVQPERVYQLLHPDLPADFPPLRSLDAYPHNLPVQLTSFVGREREIAEVKALLGRTRLLTLTGTGGCGKTRLAQQVAADRLHEYADGVWLVELAALADPDLVAQTVATALGVREAPGQPIISTLLNVLKTKQVLLVLDNCEHLIDACARLAETLLRTCPDVQILATSREVLGIAGEVSWRVPSLELPDLQQLPPADQLVQYEAVRLFVERALAVQPGFAATTRTAPAVAQVCWRLDGIPLAIELAAARVKVLPVEQLLARLENRFRLLTGGSRTALRRQQTLQATVEWSYDLLTQPERILFNRLSVFAGGCTLEAAESVCAGDGVEAWQVLDLLARLVDKSLVVANEGEAGTARYHLLETLRQYGQHRLTVDGEAEALRDRHSAYYLALAERAEPELRGARQGEWLARLAADAENLRTGLQWLVERGQVDVGLRLAGALWRFWEVRGHWTEGRAVLAELLARTPPAGALPPSAAARARALQGAGALAFYQGDYAASRTLLDESVALFRALDDRVGIAWSLIYLAWGVNDGGDPAAARPLLEESLALARAAGDRLGVAWSLARLGLTALFLGEFERGIPMMAESLTLSRALGDRWGTAWAQHLLAITYTFAGEPECGTIERLQRDSLVVWRELGARRDLAYSLAMLAMHYLSERQLDKAEPLLREALPIQAAIGDKFGVILTLAMWAPLAAAQGQAERAVRLEGAVAGLCAATGIHIFAPYQALIDREVPSARQALGETAAATAYLAGQTLTLEQAVTEALREAADG